MKITEHHSFESYNLVIDDSQGSRKKSAYTIISFARLKSRCNRSLNDFVGFWQEE